MTAPTTEAFAPVATAQSIRIVASADVAAVEARLVGFRERRSDWFPFSKRPMSGGRVAFDLALAADVVAGHPWMRLCLRNADGVTIQMLPSDGPLRAHGLPLHWVNGMFFLYDPGAFFAPPRMETIDFQPRGFLPRRVRVLLPRNYDLNTSHRYPVVYFQDGQNILHPGSVFGSWDADVTLSRLVRRGELPEVILVAIDNTRERFLEYVPEFAKLEGRRGRGGEFLRVLERELVPLINERFRTIGTAGTTAHVGSSLGGLLSFHAAAEFSHVFGICGAVSPSLWVNFRENLRIASRSPDSFARLWIDSGGPGLGDGFERTLRLRDWMLRAGHEFGPRFMHQVGPHHSHNEADWAKRFPNLLRWMFPPAAPHTAKAGAA